MSVFTDNPSNIRRNLDALPSHHTKEDIMRLIDNLQADIAKESGDLTFMDKVKKHADQHRELFFSYPMLYRTICKGTYRKVVLDILLDAKQAIESGQKTKQTALDEVIKNAVDEVNAYRKNNSE